LDKIVEKLQLQNGALQQSFRILSRSNNLEIFAKNFYNVLHEKLQVENAVILFKYKGSIDWQVLFSKRKLHSDYQHILLPANEFSISTINHSEFKVFINYPLADSAAFGILLGEKLDKSKYNNFDRVLLQFILHQLDNAYHFYIARTKEKQLTFSLNHRVLQLNSLIDTSIEVSRLQEGRHLLHLALERVLALTNASKGMLRIKMGTRVLEKIFFPFPFKSKKMEMGKYKISASFRFNHKIYSFYLFEKESREGIVTFDEIDQLLLDAFTRQVHVSLENNFLYEQSLEKERIEYEISLAGTIQKNLIPEKLPEIKGYDLYGINIPTKHVGGDYYDCIPLQDGRYMFIMADVSGKGVSAALLVSTLHASVHAYLNGPFELETLVQKLNQVIYQASTIDKYITAVFSILNPGKGELITVNAGHNPTYILRNNRLIEEVVTGGIPLGMVPMAIPYVSSKTVLKAGDSVLYYTDGVTEAMNEKQEEYDDIRSLKNFLNSQKASTAQNTISELIADLGNFTGNTPQSDDITALYLSKIDS